MFFPTLWIDYLQKHPSFNQDLINKQVYVELSRSLPSYNTLHILASEVVTRRQVREFSSPLAFLLTQSSALKWSIRDRL